ncbi:hypothetical protein [Streptomyces sp. NPDC092370]|uniref:hypothetical protein n=1 Tax=Streptomyces sp. NPDC092370 TaxID=3366016 RepID=UPI00380099CB
MDTGGEANGTASCGSVTAEKPVAQTGDESHGFRTTTALLGITHTVHAQTGISGDVVAVHFSVDVLAMVQGRPGNREAPAGGDDGAERRSWTETTGTRNPWDLETSVATVDHRCVKTNDQAVAAGHRVDPACRQEAFEGLMSRMAGRFTRVESRRRARKSAARSRS